MFLYKIKEFFNYLLEGLKEEFLYIPQAENVMLWLQALRSGKYKQGKHYLYSKGEYCVLGVACKVTGVRNYKNQRVTNSLTNKLGLKDTNGSFSNSSLTYLNDFEQKSFRELADVIEQNVDILFITPVARKIKEYLDRNQ